MEEYLRHVNSQGVTILFCMDFWRKYFPVKTNFLNDVTQGRVTVLPSLYPTI